jgi:hypothetical protein
MNKIAVIKEIVATYQKHGWQLRRVLLGKETRTALEDDQTIFDKIPIEDASVDALWFSRASHGQREAWELRMIAETPYALFETFEKDESEEKRDELRGEMEARLREYLTK